MLEHIETKTLPYTQKQMFDLVAAVDKYSEFAPWCRRSRIKKWENDAQFTADLVVGYKVFAERFTSRVYLEPEHRIFIEYLKGPLKNLKNEWRFKEAEDNHCELHFHVSFEFQNGLLQAVAKQFFNTVVNRMVDSFERRAEYLYRDH